MSPADLDLHTESIASLGGRLASGTLSAVALAEHCLDRIERHDGAVNAIIELNPEALEIAAERDRERRAGQVRGPLHGLPIALKDNIDTADRMATSAGSLALAGSRARRDAHIVTRLREAGTVLLAKTNLSEWANYRSTRSSSGWSSRGGQTRNPYALDRTPGGSSSGSAVAVAAGFVVAAIGTETDGSIVTPAAMNSVVGIKPSLGLVSRSGIIPIAHSQDTAGAMARSVADAALVLAAVAGPDPADPATAVPPGETLASLETLDAGALRGARIGVVRNYCGFHDAVDGIVEAALAELAQAGAVIVDDLELPPANLIGPSESLVMASEFKDGLNRYLAGLGPEVQVRCLADLIDYNRSHAEQVMPHFQQELLQRAAATGSLNDAEYRQALAKARHLSRQVGIDALCRQEKLDALAAPTAGPPWLIDWLGGDSRRGGCACPAAVAGYPHVTVPAGYVQGLPIGLSFFSTAFRDAAVVRLAYAFEQATRVRQPPALDSMAASKPRSW